MNDLLKILTIAGTLAVYFGNAKITNYGYLMLASSAMIIAYKLNLFNWILKKARETKEGTHGTAKFATRKDMKDLITIDLNLDAGDLLLAPLPKRIFCEEEYLYLPSEESMKHILLTGPSGSGKSRGFFMPNCAYFEGSMIITDPKSELWNHTSGFHKRSIRFAPRDPDASASFNWLPFCNDNANLSRLLARAVVTSSGSSTGDKFWEDTSVDLIAGLFAHSATFEIPTPAALYDFFTSQNPASLAEKLSESPSRIAAQLSASFINASENTRGSIIAGVSTNLSFLADDKVRRFTSASVKPVNLKSLRKKKTAVYWCLAENDVAQLRPLSSLFFSLVLHQVKESTGTLPVSFFLDEIGNIGVISSLSIEIAILRGRGISLILGIQSFSQIYALYGEREGQIIIDNCATKIFLSGCDTDTAERVSKSLGETTVTEFRTSEGDKGESRTPIKTQRRLLYADEIRQIDRDQQIIITSNKRPILSPRFFYTEKPFSRKMPALEEAKTMDFPKEPPPGKAKSFKTIPPPPRLPRSFVNKGQQF
jgi:type IV secretion system protein VirD4